MNQPTTQNTPSEITEDDEISLLEFLIPLAKHKALVLGLPLIAALVAAGVSLMLPNIYTSTTKIMPPPSQGQSIASSALAQLGGLAGLVGGAAGLKSPNDIYIAMLKSRTVADNLIQRFELMRIYDENVPSLARLRLAGVTSIVAGKDGIITIDVDDKDPKRAAALANAYVDELFKLTKVLAVTEASHRRLFFERQFEQAKNNLTNAEVAARQAIEQGGLVQVEGQGRAIVEITARLRGQIAVKEVMIGAMRGFATDRNPDLQLAQNELQALRSEVAKIEGNSISKLDNPRGKRDLGMNSLRLLRDLKYYETIYELLAKQFELAKIDEAKDSAVLQVMDKAIEPDRKSKPKHAIIVLLSAAGALVAGLMWAFARESIVKAGTDPQRASRMATFKGYLKWRHSASDQNRNTPLNR